MKEATKQLIIAAVVVAEALRKEGGCYGNEYAAIQTAADNWYKSFDFPRCEENDPPLAVRRAICLKFLQDISLIQGICNATWCSHNSHASNDRTWYFNWAGMLHGVEEDGYIHT